MKAGSMTKQEIFYIQQNPENLTIHELAKELDRSPKMIAKHYIEKKKEEEKDVPPPPVADTESPMFKLMGRHKRAGQNVATVMTKAASELADSTRSDRIKNAGRLASAIFKPKG